MLRKTGLTTMTLLALVSSGYGQVPRGSGPQGRLAAAAASDARGPRSVSVNIVQQSNPLAKMARELSRQFGIAIAYEEPAWLAAVDLMPLANAPELRNSAPEVLARINPGLRAAALGSVNVQATLSYGQDEFLAVGELLQDALDDHARRGNPGMFKVVRFGDDGYSVIPTSIRDAQGQWVSTVSPLDARISFPTEKRTLGATLALLAGAISKETRGEFEIGGVPGNASIFDTIATIGADNEVARTVLAKTLRELSLGPIAPRKIWWNLEYGVNGSYVLPNSPIIKSPVYNLRLYVVTRTDSAGRNQPTTWPTKGQR